MDYESNPAQMNSYSFPVGDWSNDGHNQCDWFRVSSPATIEDIREAHFACIPTLGFDIGDIASDGEDNSIPESIAVKLFELGLINHHNAEDGNSFVDGPEDMIKIWIKILNHINPKLQLRYEKDIDVTINFYGNDSRNRHLNTPGYGLFSI